MFKNENFIYFLSVTGFFIGLVFAIMQGFEPFNFLIAVGIVFMSFYIIAVASTSFFIKYLGIKNIFYLDKTSLEKTIDAQIEELDKKEEIIREAYYFIRKLEEEVLDVYKKSKGNK
jgi:hypothetical protein